MKRHPFRFLLPAVLLVACGKSSQPAIPAPPPISAAAQAEANEIFKTRCGACHGEQGKGDGPAAKGFNPRPRNFSDAAWQATVTDEHIEKIIVYGGAAVGKSPTMVANPDLLAKRETVIGLRMHVRALSAHQPNAGQPSAGGGMP